MPTARRSVIVFALTGIILLALGIRTGVAAIAPLASSMDLDVAMNGLPLGILGTIPPIAYALAAWFSPWFAQKVGLESAAMAVAVLGALAHVWRGISPTYLSLFVATAVLMVAAGVGNVILPGLVKLYAPNSIGTMTAAYGMALAISSSAPSFFGLWMADAAGWRVSLGAWAAISVVGIVPWLWVVSHAKMRGVSEAEIAAALPVAPPSVSMSHSPTAVAIMIIFGVSGVMAYSWFALLPQAMMELGGLSVEGAALALGIFTIMGFPLSLTIPHLASRSGWPGALVGIAVMCGLSGMLGLLLAPTLAPFLWAVLLGLGPLTFPLSLALIGYRTKNHLTALVLSGYVNKLGYLLAAAGPLVVGFVLQATGTWTLSIMFLMVVTVLELPAIWVLAKERIVDDELAEHGLSAHMSS